MNNEQMEQACSAGTLFLTQSMNMKKLLCVGVLSVIVSTTLTSSLGLKYPNYCVPNETEEEQYHTLLTNLCERLVSKHDLEIKADSLQIVLDKIFYFESRCNPGAKNSKSSATGIMQWLSGYYKNKWGYTREEFANLSRCQQLKYVEIYFDVKLSYISAILFEDLVDWYLLVLSPAHAGMTSNTILARKGSKFYDGNSGFDSNKDDVITIKEVDSFINE